MIINNTFSSPMGMGGGMGYGQSSFGMSSMPSYGMSMPSYYGASMMGSSSMGMQTPTVINNNYMGSSPMGGMEMAGMSDFSAMPMVINNYMPDPMSMGMTEPYRLHDLSDENQEMVRDMRDQLAEQFEAMGVEDPDAMARMATMPTVQALGQADEMMDMFDMGYSDGLSYGEKSSRADTLDEMLSKFDKNDSGRVTAKEAKRVIAKADTDDDGTIDRKEMRALAKSMDSDAKTLMAILDPHDTGDLSFNRLVRMLNRHEDAGLSYKA